MESGLILEKLIQSSIKFILVGGLASVVQGAPATTLNVEILYDRSADNIAKLLTF